MVRFRDNVPSLISHTQVSSHTNHPLHQDHNKLCFPPPVTPERFSAGHRITSKLPSTAFESLWVLTQNHLSDLVSCKFLLPVFMSLTLQQHHTGSPFPRRSLLSPASVTPHDLFPLLRSLFTWETENLSVRSCESDFTPRASISTTFHPRKHHHHLSTLLCQVCELPRAKPAVSSLVTCPVDVYFMSENRQWDQEAKKATHL